MVGRQTVTSSINTTIYFLFFLYMENKSNDPIKVAIIHPIAPKIEIPSTRGGAAALQSEADPTNNAAVIIPVTNRLVTESSF